MLLQSLTINGFCLMLNQIQHYHKKSKIERLYTALKSLHYTYILLHRMSLQNVCTFLFLFWIHFTLCFLWLTTPFDWFALAIQFEWEEDGFLFLFGEGFLLVFFSIYRKSMASSWYSWLSCIMLLSILEVIVR